MKNVTWIMEKGEHNSAPDFDQFVMKPMIVIRVSNLAVGHGLFMIAEFSFTLDTTSIGKRGERRGALQKLP